MRRFTIALAVGWLALPAPASAQEPKVRTIPFEGAEVFCHVLFHEGLKPIESLGALAGDQKDTLLIVFGNPMRADSWFGTDGLGRLLKNGGSLLIVTDYPFSSEKHLFLKTRGRRLVQPEQTAYRQTPQCPWLPSAWGGDHPLFHGLRKGIATNCPSSVFLQENAAVTPILTFGDDVRREHDNGGWIALPKYMVGSPKDAPPHGRALFIAGQGMFMNGMMLQSDNDNFDFAVNAIRWLREGPNGATRSKALLMVDGRIVTDFNMNLAPRAELPTPQIPIPPVQAINRLVHGMEEEQLFHKMLRGLLGDSFERVIGVLLALATFGLLLYAAKKFLEARCQHETGVPRMVGAAAPLGPGLRRGQQRQLALHQQADSAQESAQLVRAWLRAEFGVHPEQWSAGTSVAMRAAGLLWSRWNLQHQADEVLRLARSAGLVPVSGGQFSRLVETLTDLTAAHKSGRLALLVDGKNVRQVGG